MKGRLGKGMISKETIEKKLEGLPIFEYAFFDTRELSFYKNVRKICELECPRYGKTWSCPPAVGSLDECESRCEDYKSGFVFSTVSFVEDSAILEDALKTRQEHMEIVNEMKERIFAEEDVLVLTAESCDLCDTCTYPEKNCRYPEKMYPCIESHGILVTEICEENKMTFLLDHQTVTWFCLILYNKA